MEGIRVDSGREPLFTAPPFQKVTAIHPEAFRRAY
jgi:hypothetical protein